MGFFLHYIAEDPWPSVVICSVLAAAFLLALKLTQQGKYLYFSLAAVAVGVLLFGIERVWVTEVERIEQVIYDLAGEVKTCDAKAVIRRFTPDVVIVQDTHVVLEGQALRAFVLANINPMALRFDSLSVRGLECAVSSSSGRGSAEFRVLASGVATNAMSPSNLFDLSEWSLGLELDEKGEWKVNRITPTKLPPGVTFNQSY